MGDLYQQNSCNLDLIGAFFFTLHWKSPDPPTVAHWFVELSSNVPLDHVHYNITGNINTSYLNVYGKNTWNMLNIKGSTHDYIFTINNLLWQVPPGPALAVPGCSGCSVWPGLSTPDSTSHLISKPFTCRVWCAGVGVDRICGLAGGHGGLVGRHNRRPSNNIFF